MKWGIIGTGNMGSVLISAFMKSKILSESDLYITNRTLSKAVAHQEIYPKIQVEESVKSLVKQVDTVFICLKPADIIDTIKEIKPLLTDSQLLVSITSPITVEEIESLVSCQVARMVPSITNQVLSGITLLTFGNSITSERKDSFKKKCAYFSESIEVKESELRIASDIVSCGPAFFSYLASRYINDASIHTGIDKKQASYLMEKMFIGYGKLLEEENLTLEALIDKICVKKGIIGAGITAFEKNINGLFEELIDHTHQKFKNDKIMVTQQIKK